MFFFQLRQLVWKNYLIRSRSKARVITEIVWPLSIFIILALVRLRGLKEYQTECYIKEKALPSAGVIRFYQSVLCTSMNWCYSNYQNTEYFNEDLVISRARELIGKLENIPINFHITNDKNVDVSVPSSAYFSSIYIEPTSKGQSTNNMQNLTHSILSPPNGISLPMFTIENKIERALWDSKESLAHHLHNKSGFPPRSTVEPPPYEITSNYFPGWPELTKIQFLKELRSLESVYSVSLEISRSTIGKFSRRLWDAKSGTNTSLVSVLSVVCDGNPLPPNTDITLTSSKTNLRRRRVNFDTPLLEEDLANSHSENLPEICKDLFQTIQNNSQTKALFEYVYPFIRGKLVYAPNTTEFARVIEKVNTTFQDIRVLQDLAKDWLNISQNLTSSLNKIEEYILDALENLENCTLSNCLAIVTVLEEALAKIEQIQSTLDQVDSLARFFDVYTECYDFDKFVGFSSEEEAVFYGLNLLDKNQLWAVIIFDNVASNRTWEDELPPHISYKIRMDKFVIDSTTRISDYVEVPLPRNDPRAGHTKYFTSGFIFLQDRIEKSIISLHSMTEKIQGMFMQQFPGPCVMFDVFLFSVGPSFSFFMNISFVYGFAMAIKSIVYEKEQRLKETMKAMGLSNGVHWTAWFIDSMCMLLIACILLPLIIYFGNILEKSNPFVVFVFLLSFCIANVSFSFLVSTFFSRANLAAACGAFIYFLSYQPCSLLDLGYETSSYAANVALSLFSNVAFGIGNAYLIGLEESGEGAQWSNIATSPRDGDSFSLLECILMLMLDAVIYLLLTLYIEAVFPGQYGIPKPWYFVFQYSYWCKEENTSNVDFSQPHTTRDPELNEEDPRHLAVGVSVHNLGKVYSNGKVALTNLNIDFFENQITSFLGHNGAGKTTTISILTGLFPATSGTAIINGMDIRYKMDEIRSHIGICPQHNVLFDLLTVEEHLLFYSKLKSGGKLNPLKEINIMIDELGLAHKRYDLSQHLSGGMKRKLSIGAAFIGNSKTIILDEPTAGVDPYSRRSIWDILLKFKQGRTIILTTHFMDEADLLGDRIAIISQGQLKCCGSSLFLKQKLGSGYYLTIVRKEANRTEDTQVNDNQQQRAREASASLSINQGSSEQIASLVKRHIPNGKIVENVGSDIVFCLPEYDEGGQSQRPNFPQLFNELDSNLRTLDIDSYGVSDTTLEEIFLRVADDPSTASNSTDHRLLEQDDTFRHKIERGSDSFNLDSSEKLTGRNLFLQQIKALYIKRFCNSKRNWKGFFCEVILPCSLIIVGELFALTVNVDTPEPPLVLTPWLYKNGNKVFYANHKPQENWTTDYIRNMVNETGMGVRCLEGEPLMGLNCSSRVGLLNPDAKPEDFKDIYCPCTLGIPICQPNETETSEVFRYQSVTYDEFYDLTVTNISSWILHTHEQLNEKMIGGFEFAVHNNASGVLNASNGIPEQNLKVWFDNKAWASSVAYLNAINNVILRSSLPTSKDPYQYGITVINHPMEYSSREVVSTEQVALSFAYALTVMFSMSFVPASFVIFLVEERVSKSKHLQFISGVKPLTFWIASYTWDLANYAIPSVLVILIFLAFGQWEYVGATSIGGMILLLLLFGVSAIPLMYPTSFIFSVPSTAFVSLACANLFIGIVTTVSSYVLQLFDDEKLVAVGQVLDKVFLIFPHFCFGRGLMDLAEVYFTAKNFELIGVAYTRNIFEWDYLGRYFVSFIIQALIFFGFNLMLHYPKFTRTILFRRSKATLPPLDIEDEDVARERVRAENSSPSVEELLLQELTKIYYGQKLPATNRISFGLKKGECFGLLGVNGAGKSTTFKMLTGDETVSDGNAFVGGHSIITNLKEAQQSLGYCPQEDALLPLLTGVEHLQLFARLRGVPKRYIDKLVSDNIEKLSLLPFKDRCAGTYSGGNKRKLSTAIALVGNPSVVFLDEPTSGMDPKARRSLWRAVIEAVHESRSVLLTSHSMEECQVLCTRMAIMVNGTFRCLGSAQHLKNKFGDGYMITVRCDVETIVDVLQCIKSLMPQAKLREQRPRQLILHVPPNMLQVSTMFQRMEEARVTTSLIDYSITQTTLDDVFIRFARLQREILDDANPEELESEESSLKVETIRTSVSTNEDLMTSF